MKRTANILMAIAVALVINFAMSVTPAHADGPSPEQEFNSTLNDMIQASAHQTATVNSFVSAEKKIVLKKSKPNGWKKDGSAYCVFGYLQNVTVRRNYNGKTPSGVPFKAGDSAKGFTLYFTAKVDNDQVSSWIVTKITSPDTPKERLDPIKKDMERGYQECITGK